MQMPHDLWSFSGVWVRFAGESHALSDTGPWNGLVDRAKAPLHRLAQQLARKKAEVWVYHADRRRDAVLSLMTPGADTRTTCVLVDSGDMDVDEPRFPGEVLHFRG